MKRRLYFIVPDTDSAKKLEDDLLLAHIPERDMHFLAKRGTNLEGLHEASFLQKSDVVRGWEMGLLVGGATGLITALIAVNTFGGLAGMELAPVILITLLGALIGAWAASMIGISTPNKHLEKFNRDMEEGHVLLILDVAASRREEITELVRQRHPEATNYGMDPMKPVFP